MNNQTYLIQNTPPNMVLCLVCSGDHDYEDGCIRNAKGARKMDREESLQCYVTELVIENRQPVSYENRHYPETFYVSKLDSDQKTDFAAELVRYDAEDGDGFDFLNESDDRDDIARLFADCVKSYGINRKKNINEFFHRLEELAVKYHEGKMQELVNDKLWSITENEKYGYDDSYDHAA